MTTEARVRESITSTCVALDHEDFRGYLDICDIDFDYRITVWSPEIRREMLWLQKNKAGLTDLFAVMPKQNRDRAPLTRHFSIMSFDDTREEGIASVVSAVQVFRTELDGGVTSIFAIGKYLDRFRLSTSKPLLLSREVRLDTRMLGNGYHVPI